MMAISVQVDDADEQTRSDLKRVLSDSCKRRGSKGVGLTATLGSAVTLLNRDVSDGREMRVKAKCVGEERCSKASEV